MGSYDSNSSSAASLLLFEWRQKRKAGKGKSGVWLSGFARTPRRRARAPLETAGKSLFERY